MSDSNPVLLTAAHGRTGRACLRELVMSGKSVRAMVRRPEQSDELRAAGADEVVTGDFQNLASLQAAAQGCSALIYIGPPMHPDEVQMADRALHAAEAAGCTHFVYYSVLHPVCREIRHHRLKLEAEEHIVNGPLPYTILQPARYMQHLEPMLAAIRETGMHAMPFDVEVKFNVVDLIDVAKVVAQVVNDASHYGATYELAGAEALSQKQMASILSRLLRQPVIAQALPFDTMVERARKAGASVDRVAQMVAMNRHYNAHGMLGNPNVLRWLLGRNPTSYAEYVARLLATA